MSKDPEDYDFDPEHDVQPSRYWSSRPGPTVVRSTEIFDLDPESFGGTDFPEWRDDSWSEPMKRTIIASPKDVNAPIVTPEEESTIKNFLDANPHLTMNSPNEPWIQTYSGRRFHPLNANLGSIVIQDIAHALSMQCRFSGHVKKFYSVAQHSVLVSYLCDSADALWGLLHDASEAYLMDFPTPLKHSGKFDAYLDYEKKLQTLINNRFGLQGTEPASVKKADKMILATEARDLMGPLHPDWKQPEEPLPFTIMPVSQQEAKDMFIKRFYHLIGSPNGYEHYLRVDSRA